jgi:hypothetical protein
MTRSRQDPRTPPQALSPSGGSGAAPRPPDPSTNNQMAIRMVGLAVLVQMLRSRRLYERAAFAAIVLAALAGLNRESRAKALERLVAWAKRQDDRLQHKAKAPLT